MPKSSSTQNTAYCYPNSSSASSRDARVDGEIEQDSSTRFLHRPKPARAVGRSKPLSQRMIEGGQALAQARRNADAWTWQLLARCRGVDPSIFFHPDGERGYARKRRQQRAKALCAECPVAAQCREHSFAFVERFGTWGGLSEDERVRLLGL